MSEEQVRILLIEDNPVHVRLLGELIRNGSPLLSCLQLDVATTLAEGLAHLVDHTFDVVLSIFRCPTVREWRSSPASRLLLQRPLSSC